MPGEVVVDPPPDGQLILAFYQSLDCSKGVMKSLKKQGYRRTALLCSSGYKNVPFFSFDKALIKHFQSLLLHGENLILTEVQMGDVKEALDILRRVKNVEPAVFVFLSVADEDIESSGDKTFLPRKPLAQDSLIKHTVSLAKKLSISEAENTGEPLLERLLNSKKRFEKVYNNLQYAIHLDQSTTLSSEWLLDNAYVIQAQIEDIQFNLPRRFYKELPVVNKGNLKGLPLVYTLAVEMVATTDGRLDEETIKVFLDAYQSVLPLTIGELWAVPLLIRLRLIECLENLALKVLRRQRDTQEADFWANRILYAVRRQPDKLYFFLAELSKEKPYPSSHFAERLIDHLSDEKEALVPVQAWLSHRMGDDISTVILREQRQQMMEQISLSNAIMSLQRLARLDWREVFEAESEVDKIFAQEASGQYWQLSFDTRDQYRHELEKIAKRTKVPETVLASIAVELTKTGSRNYDRHIGYYLIDNGRKAFENQCGWHETVGEKLVRFLQYPIPFYLFAVLTLITLGLLSTFSISLWWAVLIPASEVAVLIANYVFTAFIKPKTIPKMDFKEGIPEKFCTLVAVPMLLSSPDEVKKEIENLEIRFLGNTDDNLRFSLIADFLDAPAREMPDDQMLLDIASDGIKKLNEKHATEQFFLFHRQRKWNEADSIWMGWERKRGKLEELNRYLMKDPNSENLLYVGNPALLQNIAFVITLDSDTQLMRNKARALVEVLAHPLNQPVLDEGSKSIERGYTIIQPRVSTSLVLDSHSIFTEIFSDPTGTDPYNWAVADLYQDIFHEGIYHGKAIYDLKAFFHILDHRYPSNVILSHDLLEGAYVRTAFAGEVELYDQFPDNYFDYAKREHRWIRGDWQILSWLFKWIPGQGGGKEENPLSYINRWKVFDNLRRSLVYPALIVLLLVSWFADIPWGTGLAAIVLVIPALLPPFQWAEFGKKLLRALLTISLLPHQAYIHCDAIVRALYRRYISGRLLLDWNTSKNSIGLSFWGMAWIPMASIALFGLLFWYKSFSVQVLAVPFLALWFLSPGLVKLLNRTVAPVLKRQLKKIDEQFLRIVARKTWRYFDDFVGPSTNWLPPDNFQEMLNVEIAKRTSSTNIGLYLLTLVSANEFGYITPFEMVDRIKKSMDTIAKLELYEGHLLNWYQIETLQPLLPRYVSTVDSGNLIASLWVLQELLDDFENQPLICGRALEGIKDILAILNKAPSPELTTLCHFINKTIHDPDQIVHTLRQALSLVHDLDPQKFQDPETRYWVEQLIKQLEVWNQLVEKLPEADQLFQQAKDLAVQIKRLADGMNMRFLYNPDRKLFSIGFNVNDKRLDNSYYDLLASEARIASYVAISKGDVPVQHWWALGRPFGRCFGRMVLQSWGGTMFEYLMPRLFMRSFEHTLLAKACEDAVYSQIEYGKRRGIPWGISESAYSGLDFHRIYQYRAFGVPHLGLKRGLEDDLVVTPYSTGLALMIDPESSIANLYRLALSVHMDGPYGYYEAIDYTRERDSAGKRGVIIYAYMAHHTAMTLLSICNLLRNDIITEYFHRDPRVASSESLLYERVSIPSKHVDIHLREVATPPIKPLVSTETMERITTPNTPIPHIQLLASDNYAIMATNTGTGYSRWEGLDINRWRADATCDKLGSFVYIRDMEKKTFWSTTYAPVYSSSSSYNVEFKADKAKYVTRDSGIESIKEIVVSPEDNVEVHCVTLANLSMRTRTIELTSYQELALAPHAADRAHPAFSKMFIETEVIEEHRGLIAYRRPRSPNEQLFYAFHLAVLEHDERPVGQYETSRARFLGEGGTLSNPAAMYRPLSGETGFVLDPIFSLRQKIYIEPGKRIKISFITGAAKSRKDALALMQKYRDFNATQRAIDMAWTSAELKMRYLHVTFEAVRLYQQIASRLVYPHQHLRASIEYLWKNKLGQRSLWSYGISGDLPIAVITIGNIHDMDMVRELLIAHTYWRMQGLQCDLVILNEEHTSYEQTLHEQLKKTIQSQSQLTGINQSGGVFLHAIDQMPPDDLALILSSARIVLNASRGTLRQQLAIPIPGLNLPAPLMSIPHYKEEPSAQLPFLQLLFFNGWGGFTTDAKEYAIFLQSTNPPLPAPWINVIANANFGTMLSAHGCGTSWLINSQSNRLTPWSNDPIVDPITDVLYLRNEDSGTFWTITPSPIEEMDPYRTRHGQGYTIYEHNSHAIEQQMEVFVPLNEAKGSVRIQRLSLTNKSSHRCRISATSYVDWVLGSDKEVTQTHVITYWDEESQALFAVNPYHTEFGGNISFLASSPLASSHTGDRTEFIGRNGSLSSPAALKRLQLSGKTGPGLDPCGAIQTIFEIDTDEKIEAIFLLGQAANAEAARELIAYYRDYVNVEAEYQDMRQWWDQLLSVIQIETPDLGTNVFFNRWLPYQNLSCRIWARSAFYQSSGAYGFRDQLQDVSGLLYIAPQIAKKHILLAASRQFVDGDVQHWWHPETGQGVRTRVSDDLLWLPYVTALYVKATQDKGILETQIPFLQAEPLKEDEHEVLGIPAISSQTGTLIDHCCRAIDRSMILGPHGLPLMGGGDWNDGMNWVGCGGKGESIWMAWFIIVVIKEILPYVPQDKVQGYEEFIKAIASNVEANGWDGDWYLRAYFDDGTPIGSKDSTEDKIDSIAQSWAVLSDVANPLRAKMAMSSVERFLVKKEDKLVLLFEPPFNKSEPNPGYIKGYPPGVRENGGQYTHAALWYAAALARQKEGTKAVEILKILSPIEHALTQDESMKYKLEPYAVAADIYSLEGHVGRGGWNWYTGSAGLMYRVWLEEVFGFRLRGDLLEIDPAIPEDWTSLKIHYNHHGTFYEILIENPNRRQAGISKIEVDGQEMASREISLTHRDGGRHTIRVILS